MKELTKIEKEYLKNKLKVISGEIISIMKVLEIDNFVELTTELEDKTRYKLKFEKQTS